MGADYKKTKVLFTDVVGIDEAEPLLGWLGGGGAAKADLSACTHLHPAVLQVLLTSGARVSAWPRDPGLRSWLQTLLPAVRPGGDHG